VAVRPAPDERVQGRFDAGGDEKHCADPERSPTEFVKAKGGDDRDDAQEEGRERHEPEAGHHLPLAEGAEESAERLWLFGRLEGRRRPGPGGEQHSYRRDDGEGGGRAGQRRDSPENGAEQRPCDRGSHRDADELAAPAPGRRSNEPGQTTGPSQRAPDPLPESGGVEDPGALGEAEGDARDDDDGEPAEHRRPNPCAHGEQTARDRSRQPSRGVDRRECSER
jgi:hypothetical protein